MHWWAMSCVYMYTHLSLNGWVHYQWKQLEDHTQLSKGDRRACHKNLCSHRVNWSTSSTSILITNNTH